MKKCIFWGRKKWRQLIFNESNALDAIQLFLNHRITATFRIEEVEEEENKCILIFTADDEKFMELVRDLIRNHDDIHWSMYHKRFNS